MEVAEQVEGSSPYKTTRPVLSGCFYRNKILLKAGTSPAFRGGTEFPPGLAMQPHELQHRFYLKTNSLSSHNELHGFYEYPLQ